MSAYVEIVGAVALTRYELSDSDLRAIGRFIRGNVLTWLDSHKDPTWVGILPVEDFRAVCDDTEIPWATEDGKRAWEKVYSIH